MDNISHVKFVFRPRSIIHTLTEIARTYSRLESPTGLKVMGTADERGEEASTVSEAISLSTGHLPMLIIYYVHPPSRQAFQWLSKTGLVPFRPFNSRSFDPQTPRRTTAEVWHGASSTSNAVCWPWPCARGVCTVCQESVGGSYTLSLPQVAPPVLVDSSESGEPGMRNDDSINSSPTRRGWDLSLIHI